MSEKINLEQKKAYIQQMLDDRILNLEDTDSDELRELYEPQSKNLKRWLKELEESGAERTEDKKFFKWKINFLRGGCGL